MDGMVRCGEKRGLILSEFTLGTVQLGCNYGIANQTGQPSEQECYKILDLAVGMGVNSFDTASDYEASEEIIGLFFNERKTAITNPVIITKISGIDYASDSRIKESVFKQADESLEKLKLERIPLLMLHYFSDYKKADRVISECMEELKQRGKADKTGISLYAEDDIELVLKEPVFDAVQVPLNIFDHRLINSGILDEFAKKDLIVFVRSVFLQGLFFLNKDQLPPGLEKAKPYLDKLQELSERAGMSIAQLCVSFVKNLDGVTSLVIGCEKAEQVVESISLVENPQTICDEVLGEIFDFYRQVPREIINPNLWKAK